MANCNARNQNACPVPERSCAWRLRFVLHAHECLALPGSLPVANSRPFRPANISSGLVGREQKRFPTGNKKCGENLSSPQLSINFIPVR